MDFLFGFSGRINRAKIWLWLLINLGVWLVAAIIAGVISGIAGSMTPLVVIYAIVFIVTLISYIAVLTKRLHDRNKSAMWLLVFVLVPLLLSGTSTVMTLSALMAGGDPSVGMGGVGGLLSLVSVVISIWAFVELWCLRGTVGANQYGPDPLELKL